MPRNFDTTASTSQDEFGADFLPNELDLFDQVAYHFTLSMVSDEAIAAQKFYDPSLRVVIAESGVTGISIDDVVIETIPGTTSKYQMSSATTFQFTLREPYGCILYDRLYYAAQRLGVANWLKTTYILELSFKARNTMDSIPVDLATVLRRKWVWPITITNMDMAVNASGTVYEAKAVKQDDLSTVNQFSDIDKGVSISGDTVGKILNDLASVLTRRQRERAPNGQYIPDEWKFVIHPDIANQPIVPVKPDENPSRLAEYYEGSNGVKTIQYPDSMDISKIIDAVMAATPYLQKEAMKSDVSNSNINTVNEYQEFTKLYRTYSETIQKQYDKTRGDYARIFVYNIVPYKTADIISSKAEENNPIEKSERKYNAMIRDKMIRKRYHYLYTGLNDQILDFNMNFNFLWYVDLPMQAGTSNFTTYDNGAVLAPDQSKTKLAESTKAISQAKFSASPTAETYRPEDSTGTTEKSSLNDKAKTPRISETEQQPTVSASFAEDIDVTGGIRLPITTLETPYSVNNKDGIEDFYHGGKSFVSAMFTQSLHSKNGDLLSIELTIKGDPFWFDAIPVETSAIAQHVSVTERAKMEETGEVGNYTSILAQNYFLFTSQSPVESIIAGDNLGGFTQSTVINGLYYVITTRNEFSKGTFKQILSAVREKLTDVNLLNIDSL